MIATKMVSEGENKGREFMNSIDTNQVRAAENITRRLERHLKEGEQMPDVAFLFELLNRECKSKLEDLVVAEQEYIREEGEDSQRRKERTDASDDCYRSTINVRATMTQHMDPSILKGMEGKTPREPTLLKNYATSMARKLRDPEIKLLDPLPPGIELNPTLLADWLEEKISVLQATLDRLSKDERETEETIIARNSAADSWESVYVQLAEVIHGFYGLAGLEEEADRLRPTRPRTSGKSAKEDEKEDDLSSLMK